MTSTCIVFTFLTYTDSLIHSRLIVTDMQITIIEQLIIHYNKQTYIQDTLGMMVSSHKYQQ